MAYPTTIQDCINNGKTRELTYRKTHTNIFLNKNGDVVKIPYKSIIREYMPYFLDTVIEADFTKDEEIIYRYKPKSLSYDLYGTTELWSALLELNNMLSINEFNMRKKIKVFIPTEFLEKLNEVLILEKVLK